MSPKPPVVHAGNISHFSGPAGRFAAPCSEKTGPEFAWQHQALNRPRIGDTIGKRHSETSNRDQPPLLRMNISAQGSPKKTFDQLPLLLNSSYAKNGSYECNTAIGNVRDSHCQARPSSASTCGDLEGPSRLTPGKSHLPIRDERQKATRHPEENLGTRYSGDFDHRSRSRTSNISRKRSSVNKHRSRTDPERKKMLMHQVAQYWNECISIAEEEKSQAVLEVDQLREHLRQQQAKLERAHQHLDKERAERQDIERKLKDSELVHAEALLKNSTLTQEANTVKEDLRVSKERAAGLTEKCKTFRVKLNEAILEQQRLFLQAKEFYHESIQKLRQDNESRVAERNAVETALAACGEKRCEMRRCLDELRSGLEKEVESRGQQISHLQDKISMQGQALATERQITSDLRRQVEDLKTLIESLRESITTNAADQSQQVELTSDVCSRLQILEELVKSLASHPAKETDTDTLLQHLHTFVSTDIYSALISIGGAQGSTYETLMEIKDGCQTELGAMRSALSDLSRQLTGIQDHSTAMDHSSIIMQSDIEATKQLCEKIGQGITTWFTKERTAMDEERYSWKEDIFSQLVERNERIEELKKMIHEAGLTCLAKFDSVSKTIATTDDEAKHMIQEMMHNFRSALDQDLQAEKTKAEYDAKETQRVLTSLETQIGSVSEQLRTRESQLTNEDELKDRNRQDEGIEMLRDKICQLEKEASRTTDLQERWHSDIHMVDSIRAKLRSLERLPSQVDKYHDELERSSQISNLLESTSGYLVEQETWVKQQLKASSHEVSKNMVTPPRTAEPTNNSGTIGNFDGGIEIRPDGHDMGSSQSSRPEFGPKRVQVQSPTEAHSPSSPPSVEQEQKRRRIPVTVRPILKANSVHSSQESTTSQQHVDETNTETEIETELGPVQERRKMVADIITRNVSQKIIDEISSGFITGKPEGGFFDLPRVTDFHVPLNVMSSRYAAQKRKLEHENAGSTLKRVNLANGSGLIESAGRRSSENGRLGDTRHKTK